MSKIAKKFRLDVYGWRLLPVLVFDFCLSWFARRSYPVFTFWQKYKEKTDFLFDDTKLDKKLSFEKGQLSDLKTTGLLVLPCDFSAADIELGRDYILERRQYAKARAREIDPTGEVDTVIFTEAGITYYVALRRGRTRFHFLSEVLDDPNTPNVIRSFFNHEVTRSYAKAYFGCNDVFNREPHYMGEVVEPSQDFEDWHLDGVKPTLKCFLTLTDVGDNQAPLRYLKGSHEPDEKKRRKMFDFVSNGITKIYYSKSENKLLDEKGIRVVAPLNTILMFETRGTHSGSACNEGVRVTLCDGYRARSGLRFSAQPF